MNKNYILSLSQIVLILFPYAKFLYNFVIEKMIFKCATE